MKYPLITHVHLTLTHRCNFACKYCFVAQESLDMTLQVAKDSADFLARNAKIENTGALICFFGGEPLLKWHEIIVPLIAYNEENNADVKWTYTITTNCYLLTEDKVNYMKEKNIKILTSIDGAPETQNYNRPLHGGLPTAHVVEKNIRYLMSQGIYSTFRSTVIPATCHLMYENYLYAISLGYKGTFFITDAFTKWPKEDEAVVLEQLYKIADHYIAHWREHKRAPINLNIINRYWFANERIARYRREGVIKNLELTMAKGKCGLGQSKAAAISPAGDIYGCQELTSNEGKSSIFYIGNIYEGTDDALRAGISDLYNRGGHDSEDHCETCELNLICKRGCSANNYLITGCLESAAHGYCFFQRQLYEIALYIQNQLKDIPEFIRFARRSGEDSKRNLQNWTHPDSFLDKNQRHSSSNKCDPKKCGGCTGCPMGEIETDPYQIHIEIPDSVIETEVTEVPIETILEP